MSFSLPPNAATVSVAGGTVSTQISGGVGRIAFHHPKGNSLPGALLRELAVTVDRLGADETVRVIQLSSGGTGPFCAGASFDELVAIETPAYVVDVALLRQNMEKLARVQSESGACVLLALKGFSMFSVFPIMREYLSGCCASGLNEALLAQEFGKEVHVYAPAFKEAVAPCLRRPQRGAPFNSASTLSPDSPPPSAAAQHPPTVHCTTRLLMVL